MKCRPARGTFEVNADSTILTRRIGKNPGDLNGSKLYSRPTAADAISLTVVGTTHEIAVLKISDVLSSVAGESLRASRVEGFKGSEVRGSQRRCIRWKA